MHDEDWIERDLAIRRRDHGLRELVERDSPGGKVLVDGREALNFSSNDYLDLARHPRVREEARRHVEEYGAGAGAARLVTGSLPCHTVLERQLAEVKGYPAALVFGSGYLANVGIVPAVAGAGDQVFIDQWVHASVVDAVLLSRAQFHRFKHNDANHLTDLLAGAEPGGRRLVVTESVFSMDGDVAPLAELAAAAEAHGAMMMVDEAHSTGVFGPGGRGLTAVGDLRERINLSMGTLGKALGGYGGFVACSAAMKTHLINAARSFVYTTAPPPAAVGAALGALAVVAAEPDAGATLLRRAERFRAQLREAGLDTGASASQIVPVMVGDNARALDLADRLRQRAILAVAIRPPTVPAGTARIRLSVTLAHTDIDLDRAVAAIVEAAREVGVL